MDNFKKATVKDYTSWDLNCRSICPHDKSSNKLESASSARLAEFLNKN